VADSFCVGTTAEGGCYIIAAVVWVQCKYLKGLSVWQTCFAWEQQLREAV
jgi:hypothetical protein